VYLCFIGKTAETKALAEELNTEIKKAGFETLFDDRQLGPGQMFKDADLIGLPIRVVLGERDYQATGEIEVKIRKNGETLKVKKEELIPTLQKKLQELGKWL
jgi:prolyl-tRNA synthetase